MERKEVAQDLEGISTSHGIRAKRDALMEEGIGFFDQRKYIRAIENFATVIALTDDELARRFLARCYFRLEMYDDAYRNFQLLRDRPTGTMREYAISMLATIEVEWGNIDKAFTMLKSLPEELRNLINMANLLWRKYKITHDLSLLDEAMIYLDRVEAEGYLLKMTYHLKAIIYQEKGDYKTAKKYYTQAIQVVKDDLTKGRILNDYASLYIVMGDYDEAENLLFEARPLVEGKSSVEVEENEEWMEVLASKQVEKGKQLFERGCYIEAIECFSKAVSYTENDQARQYLAICYYKLENYDMAYQHFHYLAEHTSDKIREYGISMVASIETIWGNYNKAIKTLRRLPENTRNLINLSVMYWKKYLIHKDEFSIREAMRLLNKIDLDDLSHDFVGTIDHLKAMIYQAQKDYGLSEDHYASALEIVQEPLTRGRVLNDYASLLIECKRYDEAGQILAQARELVAGKNEHEEAFNNKWHGVLAIAQEQYVDAIEYLERAAKVLRDKALYQELAGIYFLQANFSRQEDFFKAAEYFADGLVFEKLSEEMKDRDEKVLNFYFNSFFGRNNNFTIC